MASLDQWFLTSEERGNAASQIDERDGECVAWTEGNLVTPLIDPAGRPRRLRRAGRF